MRKTLLPIVLSLFILAAASPKELKEDAQKRIASNANDFKAVFNLGYAEFQLNDYKASLEQFRRALLLAPDRNARAMVRYNMGNVLFMQKKIKEALREYRAGLRLTPDDPQLQYNYTVAKMVRKGKGGGKSNNKRKQQKKNGRNKKGKSGNKDKKRGGKSGTRNRNDKTRDRKKRTGVMKKEDAKRILQALKQREGKRIKARTFKAKSNSSSIKRKEW